MRWNCDDGSACRCKRVQTTCALSRGHVVPCKHTADRYLDSSVARIASACVASSHENGRSYRQRGMPDNAQSWINMDTFCTLQASCESCLPREITGSWSAGDPRLASCVFAWVLDVWEYDGWVEEGVSERNVRNCCFWWITADYEFWYLRERKRASHKPIE